MSNTVSQPTRREYLAVSGLCLAGLFAGCTDDDSPTNGRQQDNNESETDDGVDSEAANDDNDTAETERQESYGAFFPLTDWAEHVSDGSMTVSGLVETGQTAHDWTPDENITVDLSGADLFFYFDAPEFSWAQEAASTLEQDDIETVVVDLLEPIEVVDELDTTVQESHDVHVWTDPIIVQELIKKIAATFEAHDPDNAEIYRENAASYNERVEAVHDELLTVTTEAQIDTAVFTGHDAFRYLERRYEIELVTPTGISPDAQPSASDIVELVETIETNGIDTILYDPFQTTPADDGLPEVAETLLEESAATDAKPLTPLTGTTVEWEERDWGWVEQMEQINLPALEAALNPD